MTTQEKRFKDCLTHEECVIEIQKIQKIIDELKAEYKENEKTIKNKVKGQIRKAQIRNKEIKKEIYWCELGKNPYYNGGVW